MPSLVVVGHLKATSKPARDKIIQQFDTIARYSQSEEPGVLKYGITVPRDMSDETSIYAIEEYSTQAVSDDHIASSPVQDLISMFGTEPSVLAAPPKVYQLEYTGDGHHFTRSEVVKASDPFVVFATARQPSTSETAALIDTWSKVIRVAESQESNTLMYCLVRDKEDSTQIGTIEAYVDQNHFDDHCKSSEVAALVAKNDEIKGEMSYVTLRLVTGWLSR